MSESQQPTHHYSRADSNTESLFCNAMNSDRRSTQIALNRQLINFYSIILQLVEEIIFNYNYEYFTD